MSVLQKIAFYQNRRDEVPNQELARELAQLKDRDGIREIADHLWDKNKNVRSDCLKVLYEVGYIHPDLTVGCAADFLKLLTDKENRLVWGAMIGLANIALMCADEIWAQIETVVAVTDRGTLITFVNGVKVIAKVAAANPVYYQRLYPLLISYLHGCGIRDLPMLAESVLVAVTPQDREDFLALLEYRQPEMSPSQLARLKKVIRSMPK